MKAILYRGDAQEYFSILCLGNSNAPVQQEQPIIAEEESQPGQAVCRMLPRLLHQLAGTLYGKGLYAEAAKFHHEEMNDYLRVLGPKHRETLNAMIALTNVLDDQGKFW